VNLPSINGYKSNSAATLDPNIEEEISGDQNYTSGNTSRSGTHQRSRSRRQYKKKKLKGANTSM
jgi:hypothetical protein